MWHALTAMPFSWASWWPELTNLRAIETHPDMIGTRFSCTWRAPSGYRLHCDFTITGITPHQQIVLDSSGDLVGTSVWKLSDQAGATNIAIDWQAQTTKRWMNLLSFLLKPAFVYNHDAIMRSGERGLRRYLSE